MTTSLQAICTILTMGVFERGRKLLSPFGRGANDRPPFEALYAYALSLVAGYMVADLSILSFRPQMLPNRAPPAKPAKLTRKSMSERSDYFIISERNIFNADGLIPPALSDRGEGLFQADVPAVLSQLPLKLEGTIVHANPKRSVATILFKSKNETQSYMVDDEIEGLARITKVERRRLIFRNLNNNRLEYIDIPQEGAIKFGGIKETAGTSGGSDDLVQKRGEFDFAIKRDILNKYLTDFNSLLNQARMVPNIPPSGGGKIDGFRFVSIQPGSPYELLGFKAGDVIKAVNNEPVNSPTKAMELYNALKSEGRIALVVEREGRDENFKYDITD